MNSEDAPRDWVWLADVLSTVERELGIASAVATKELRSALRNLRIDTDVPGLSPYIADILDKEGFVSLRRGVPFVAVAKGGWPAVDWQSGKLKGWNIRVCWAQVVETLEALTPQHVQEAAPTPDPVRRRRPAGLNYAEADRPLVEEMHRLVARGSVRGPYDAALKLADGAVGHGTSESKAKRLLRRYSASLSSEHD